MTCTDVKFSLTKVNLCAVPMLANTSIIAAPTYQILAAGASAKQGSHGWEKSMKVQEN